MFDILCMYINLFKVLNSQFSIQQIQYLIKFLNQHVAVSIIILIKV